MKSTAYGVFKVGMREFGVMGRLGYKGDGEMREKEF
jgi:hypothetical protein